MASWDMTKSLDASMICTLVLLCLLSAVTQCSIIVSDTETNETYFLERMAESTFGDDLPTDGLSGYLVIAKPLNACSPIQRPPSVNISEGMKWIALISRSDKNSPCTFAEKVLNAQEHNYAAVIVYNRRGEEAVFSMNSDSGQGRLVVIPSVFVGYSDGFHMGQFSWTHSADRYVITVKPSDYPIDLNYYLLPFAIVVGVCFVLMLVFMLAKWIRDYRKRRRSRLSKTNLKKLPVKKFKKGDNYDICAICLDEYENGDKLRILPCAHAYHMKCVDPWLTNNKRTCPVCKRKVLANDNERNSDSDESGDDDGPSETTPLLPPPGDTSQRRSTFENSGLPISTHPVSVNVASSGSTEGPDSPRPHGRHNSAYESDSSDDDAGQAGVSARPGPFEGEQGTQEVQVESDDIVFHSGYFEMKPDNPSPPQSTAEVPACGVDGVSTSTTHECDDGTTIGDINTTQADVVVQTNRDAPDGTEIV